MLPLSFSEYVSFYRKDIKDVDERLYLNYVNRGSFPYAVNLDSEKEIDDYIEIIYNTIILKDIVSRKKIADTLTSDGRSISVHTVDNYLETLVDVFIFNKVPRFDIKSKQCLMSGEKYYATDVSMRYAILGRKNLDAGHILENIVYLELLRRGYKVYVGKTGEKEVDFVVENKEGYTYYQVALTTRDEKTLERELSSLQAINNHYPKFILMMDMDLEADFDGIKKINVLDWLLDNKK